MLNTTNRVAVLSFPPEIDTMFLVIPPPTQRLFPRPNQQDAFEDAGACAGLLVFCVVVMPFVLVGWLIGEVVEWVAG